MAIFAVNNYSLYEKGSINEKVIYKSELNITFFTAQTDRKRTTKISKRESKITEM